MRKGSIVCRSLPAASILMLTLLIGCTTPDGNSLDGKKWFAMHNCSACHGPNGNDGGAPNIVKVDMSYSSFVRKLRTTDAPIMPYYPESKISDQDAADIYVYLQNLE